MRKKELYIPPGCPFCRQDIEKPQPADERKFGEFAVGRCQCGAVYVSDPTGFNLGAAFVECLVYACGNNWDLAWDLLPESDYLTDRVEDYDEQTHQIVETRNIDGRSVKGVLSFVRLHEEITDITQRTGAKERSAEVSAAAGKKTVIAIEAERDPKRDKKRASKTLVRDLVENGDIDSLVDLCFDDNRTLRFMQRLLFDPDENKRWTVAHIMGKIFGRVSTLKPGQVSDVLRRLFESCADSAAANWGAVEAIGEIIAARPDIYGAFTGHLLQFAGDSSMQVQVVWALGTIAQQRPELIRAMPFYGLFALLDSPDPLVKGHALRLFGRIQAKEVLGQIKEMTDDRTAVLVYEEGKPLQTEIGQLAEEAIALINQQEEGKV